MRRALIPLVLVAALAAPPAHAAQEEPLPQEEQDVLVVGDSLAVGMRPWIGTAIEARPVRYSVRGGIGTPVGVKRLREALEVSLPTTVVLSLGTNDGPDPLRFNQRVQRILELVPADACVVWPSIHRAKRKGPFRQLNRVLRDIASRDRRITIIPWDRMIDRGTARLPDGVHPDDAGYQLLGAKVSQAVRKGCRLRRG